MSLSAMSKHSNMSRFNWSTFYGVTTGTHTHTYKDKIPWWKKGHKYTLLWPSSFFRAQTKLIFFQRQKSNKFNVAVQDVTIFTQVNSLRMKIR